MFTDSNTGFRYLKVDFDSNDADLLNGPAGQSLQAQNPAGYHITICCGKTYKEGPRVQEATDEIERKYGDWYNTVQGRLA